MNLISLKCWPFIKTLFCIWLYYPTYRGALLLEQLGGNYIDLANKSVGPVASKILPLLKFPPRDVPNFRNLDDDKDKKTQ